MKSELPTQRLIVDWLNLQSGTVAFLNELPSGMPSKYSPTGYRRLANRRTPDILGCRNGRMLAIEVKKESYRERVTELWDRLIKGDYSIYRTFKLDSTKETERCKGQAENLLWLYKAGALCMFAFNLEDVKEKINET